MTRTATDVLDEVHAAIRSQSKRSLSGLALEFDLSIDLCGPFPDSLFIQYAALWAEPLFWRHEDAWEFVRQAENSWDLFSERQREQLWPLLIESFDKWSNSMGAFVVGELLGRRYGGQDALDALSRLARDASMPARGLVPHGLGVLARRTTDTELRRRAVLTLRQLEKDSNDVVREEARLALMKI